MDTKDTKDTKDTGDNVLLRFDYEINYIGCVSMLIVSTDMWTKMKSFLTHNGASIQTRVGEKFMSKYLLEHIKVTTDVKKINAFYELFGQSFCTCDDILDMLFEKYEPIIKSADKKALEKCIVEIIEYADRKLSVICEHPNCERLAESDSDLFNQISDVGMTYNIDTWRQMLKRIKECRNRVLTVTMGLY